MLAASGIRSVFGVYIKPMEAEFGWGRGALSGAAAISLLLLGAAGPVVGRLADRWGPRRIVIVSLLLLGIGSIGASYVQKLWHVYVTTGFLMALGAGGGRGEVAARAPPGGDVRAAVLAPDGDVLRLRLHLQRDGAHALHAARPRAQLQRAAGLDGARGDGRHERGGHDLVGLDLRQARPARAAGVLLLLPRRLASVPTLRLERAVTACVGRDLRAQLHLDRAADDDAHREHLRAL